MSFSSQKGVFDRGFEVNFTDLNIFAPDLVCGEDSAANTGFDKGNIYYKL